MSRSIGRLEARLGARLFNRTTRSVKLTAGGKLYHAQCQQALEQIAEAERALDALRQHDLIQFVLPSTGRPMPWILRTPEGEDIDFSFRSRQRVHEDVLAGVGWAAAGGGLFQIYHFVAREAVKAGQLVEVMQRHGGRSRPFHVLYPQNRHLSARVRAFVQYLAEAVAPSARQG